MSGKNKARGVTFTWAATGHLLALAALAIGCSGGCGHYNRFAPARDQPRAVERADGLVTAAERALDNAEQRADNIID